VATVRGAVERVKTGCARRHVSVAGVSEGAASVPLSLLEEVEEQLFTVLDLDVWERCIYYRLLRLSLSSDAPASIQFALATTAKAMGMSEDKIRRSVRSMAVKGCIRIEDRGKNGHLVRVLLPSDIDAVRAARAVDDPVDLESIDFHTDRRYLYAIVQRENGECFYCGRVITLDTAVLDHVVADVDGGGNSHRNIVAACHECNSLKQAAAPDDFVRRLYRGGLLSQQDVTARLERLVRLRAGLLPIDLSASP
jgi:hypothetical protein